jgi:ribulose-5-phosphate 4-epimerase/fuculose-1-phosphate aldolase
MLTVGRSTAEAFKLMHNLERSCRAQLAIQASGAEIAKLSQGVARKTAEQYASSYDKIEAGQVPDNEWAAFKRMLARTDPDFMN